MLPQHQLISVGKLNDFDIAGTILAMASQGRFPLAGDDFRAERDELAAVLVDGVTADVLRSGRAITVDSAEWGYLIQEIGA